MKFYLLLKPEFGAIGDEIKIDWSQVVPHFTYMYYNPGLPTDLFKIIISYLDQPKVRGLYIGRTKEPEFTIYFRILKVLKYMKHPAWSFFKLLNPPRISNNVKHYRLKDRMKKLYKCRLSRFYLDLRNIIISYIDIPTNRDLLRLILEHPDFMVISNYGNPCHDFADYMLSKEFSYDFSGQYSIRLDNISFHI